MKSISESQIVEVFGTCTSAYDVQLEQKVGGLDFYRLPKSDLTDKLALKRGDSVLLTFRVLGGTKRTMSKIQKITGKQLALLLGQISDFGGEPKSLEHNEATTGQINKASLFLKNFAQSMLEERENELTSKQTKCLEKTLEFFETNDNSILFNKKLIISVGEKSEIQAFEKTLRDYFVHYTQNIDEVCQDSDFNALFVLRVTHSEDALSHFELLNQNSFGEFGRTPNTDFEWVDGYFVQPQLRDLFRLSHLMKDSGQNLNVLMVGPSGYGKTSVFEALAKSLGYDFHRENCATVLDTEAWFGYHEANEGSTLFVPTVLTQKIVSGNCVIVFDEFNRLEPWVSNSLFPILDHSGRTIVHGEEIIVGPNVIFGMTMNQGVQYVGTFNVDKAMLNRVHTIFYVEPMKPEHEIEVVLKNYKISQKLAKNLVNCFNSMRAVAVKEDVNVDISTRMLLNVARLISLSGDKLSPRRIITFALINHVPVDDRKSFVDIINSVFGVDEQFD